MIRIGKTLYLRFGNFLRRVAIDKVRPDPNGEIKKEEGYVEQEIETNTAKFTEEETPVEELAEDLAVAERNTNLENQVKNLQEQIISLTKLNVETNDKNTVEEQTEEKRNVISNRQEKRKAQKAKKQAEQVKVPKTGQHILFKEKEADNWKSGRVVGSWKKNSKYRYWKHVLLGNDLIVQKDFENGVHDWKPELDANEELEDTMDTYVLETDPYGVFPVHKISSKDYDMPEIQTAIQAEISKYKNFQAFEEVQDQGQKSIPTRWVVTEQSSSGKNEPYKARLCIRGDLERGKEDIRSDSPTASKEAIKLALIIAANEGFKVKS